MTAIEIHGTAAGFVAEVVGVLSSGRDGGVLHQTPAFDDPDLAQVAGQQARASRRWADHDRYPAEPG